MPRRLSAKDSVRKWEGVYQVSISYCPTCLNAEMSKFRLFTSNEYGA
jgi:hypothetical protein